MLEELSVSNLGVIASARLEPGPGLTVITGETGAGKTLLLGALRLLTGAAAGGGQVGRAGDEASVEGRFTMPGGEELVAARRLVAGGRSRAYLDGRMAPNRLLEERAGSLVEIVGQHDRLALTRAGELRAMLDAALDDGGRQAHAAYVRAWEHHLQVAALQAALGGDRGALERELDLVRFQAEEIGSAGFAEGDDAVLAARAARLRNAEALAEATSAALDALEGDGSAGDTAGRAADLLRRAARHDPDLGGIADGATDLANRAAELAGDLRRYADGLDGDPDALAAVEQRLALLAGLRRKYGADLDEVLAFGAGAVARVVEIEELIGRAAGLEAELAEAAAAVEAAGAELRVARCAAAKLLADRALIELRGLAFADPVVEFRVTPAPPGPAGADAVDLAFASDASLPVGPIGRIASGGELSRIVLALRLAGGAGEAAVVAFDEVDAGVGGATALAVGRKLADLALHRQVLCVTHLPQVAAFAATHVVIDREGRVATARVVDGEERLQELTRMLSGLPESARGKEHAGELLALAAGG